ncbi:MAG: Peptidase M23 [Parcubacteria bacterium 33_209]|jgi:murein DD-endopeptidase MepM/ murein hydrolase activator NlpD|nr:MAG: Peptidase M23 [Parcubacteria bacterium 33_209]
MNNVKNNPSAYLSWAMILVLFVFIFIVGATDDILAQEYLEHQKKEEDSVWSITRQFQLSIQEVVQVNNIRQNQPLSSGQFNKIPKNEENSSSSNGVVSAVTHTVQKGESLWDIAQQYRLSLEHISAVNDLNQSDSLPIGQEIKIPLNSTKKGEAKKKEAKLGLSFKKDQLNDQEMSTTLKQEFRNLAKEVNSKGREDESLWAITQNYQVSLKEASHTNDVEDSERISLSQMIKTSPGSRSGNEENKNKGRNAKEPLQNISQPSVDQKSGIPVNEGVAKQEAGSTSSVAQTEKTKKKVIHYVRKGETLWQISRKYQVSVKTIASTNQISESERLVVGQRLVIPDTRNSSTSSCSFIWPLNGPITSQFGIRTLGARRNYHTGIDIDAPIGAFITAAASGKVSFSGYINGYGNVVIIEHAGAYSTVYAHSASNLVKEGQNVTKGEVICKLGSTGNATGSHLHFEIREDGRPVNPLGYLP